MGSSRAVGKYWEENGNGWILLALCCAVNFLLVYLDVFDLYGKGRGLVAPFDLNAPGGIGFPLSDDAGLCAMFSVWIFCAGNVRDAVKLAAANLCGILLMGLCSLLPDYGRMCTHDAVLVAAWIAGAATAEGRLWLRCLLSVGALAMALNVGELAGLFGKGACPLNDWVAAAGKVWLGAAGTVAGFSVFSKILGARLGWGPDDKRVWAASLAVSLALFWDWMSGPVWVKVVAWEHRVLMGYGELAWFFGEKLSLAAGVVGVALWCGAGYMRLRKSFVK